MILSQSCKIYNNPVSFEQAVKNEEDKIVKITMNDGNEFVYESLEINDGLYYGIQNNGAVKVKIPLNKDEIQSVQLRKKNSSKGTNALGIGVGILSIITGALMI
ncbi:MAG: hypothetical protein HKP59_10190 [Lutibacter sp.]|nr:hypothetical protein [Lutibacter sp.]NNJ58843.1 hypothetical protein [Lutibacter sp.]